MDAGPVGFDRAPGDMELRRDLAARVSERDQAEDLDFPRAQLAGVGKRVSRLGGWHGIECSTARFKCDTLSKLDLISLDQDAGTQILLAGVRLEPGNRSYPC